MRSAAFVLAGALLVCCAVATVVDLSPVADCHVDDSSPTGSNGQGLTLCSGITLASGFKAALLQFDLTSIPTDATIDAAELHLTLVRRGGASDGSGLAAFPLVQAWTEPTTTADNCGLVTSGANNQTSWTFPWASLSSAFLFNNQTVPAIVTNEPVLVLNATAPVAEWISLVQENFGLVVVNVDSPAVAGSAVSFHSREAANETERPLLRVTYTQPSATGAQSTTTTSTTTATSTSTTTTTTTTATTTSTTTTATTTSTSTTTHRPGTPIIGTPACLSISAPDTCPAEAVRQKSASAHDGDFCGWCETLDEQLWYYCSDTSLCVADDDGIPHCEPQAVRAIGETCGGTNVFCEDSAHHYDVVCNGNSVCGASNAFAAGEHCPEEAAPTTPGAARGCVAGSVCLSIDTTEPPVCTFSADGTVCSAALPDCVSTSACRLGDDGVSRCTGRAAIGQNCSGYAAERVAGLATSGCVWNAECIEDVCREYGSRRASESCVTDASCEAGLACVGGVCSTLSGQGQACSDASPCAPGLACLCNYEDLSSTCFRQVPGAALDALKAFAACVAENECTLTQTFWEGNCLAKHCGRQYRKLLKAQEETRFDDGLREHSSAASLVVSLLAVVAAIALAL